jgi:hypothetical protein
VTRPIVEDKTGQPVGAMQMLAQTRVESTPY